MPSNNQRHQAPKYIRSALLANVAQLTINFELLQCTDEALFRLERGALGDGPRDGVETTPYEARQLGTYLLTSDNFEDWADKNLQALGILELKKDEELSEQQLQHANLHEDHMIIVRRRGDLSFGDFLDTLPSTYDRVVSATAMNLIRQNGKFLPKQRAIFVKDLLVRDNADPTDISREAAAAGVPIDKPCRLILFEDAQDSISEPEQYVLSVIEQAFPTGIAFNFQRASYLLCWEDDLRMDMNAQQLEKVRELCESRGKLAYASDAIESILQIKYAQEETLVARRLRLDIDAIRHGFGTANQRKGVYQYYESVLFFSYLDIGAVQSEEWALATASYPLLPLQKVIEHDDVNGTDDCILLYCYLLNDGRINNVSERMHMHRNSVRRRIDRICTRHSFNLEDPLVRQRLQNDYRVLISRSDTFRENICSMLD